MRAFISLLIASIFIPLANAHDMKTDTGLVIEHPWAKVSIPGARMSAAYLEIENTSNNDDVLIGATVEGVNNVEIHEIRMDGDMMMMQRLSDGLVVPAGGYVTLQPGSYHLMLMGLTQPLVDGTMVKGTLIFAQAGTIEVMFMVEPLTKADEKAEARMNHTDMKDMGHDDHNGMAHDNNQAAGHDQMGTAHSNH